MTLPKPGPLLGLLHGQSGCVPRLLSGHPTRAVGGAGGCPQVLSVHGAELATEPPVPMSSVAELRPSPPEPGGSHKSRGYTRPLSPAVFDRHQIQFPREGTKSPAVTALRLRHGPACSHPRHPPRVLPRSPSPCPTAQLRGRGCPPGDPRLSPLVAASPQAPSWHHRPGGCFLRGWGFGARGNTAPSQPQSCRAGTWEGSPKTQGAGHRQHGDNAPQITPQRPDPTPTCTNWVPTGCHAARGRASPPCRHRGDSTGVGDPPASPGWERGGRGAAGWAPAPARLRRSAEESR